MFVDCFRNRVYYIFSVLFSLKKLSSALYCFMSCLKVFASFFSSRSSLSQIQIQMGRKQPKELLLNMFHFFCSFSVVPNMFWKFAVFVEMSSLMFLSNIRVRNLLSLSSLIYAVFYLHCFLPGPLIVYFAFILFVCLL